MFRSQTAVFAASIIVALSGCAGGADPAAKSSPKPSGPSVSETAPHGTFTSRRAIIAAPKGEEDAVGTKDKATWTLKADCVEKATSCSGTVTSSGGAKLTYTWDGKTLVFLQDAYDEQVPACLDEDGKEIKSTEIGLHRTYELGPATVETNAAGEVTGWSYEAVERTTPVDDTEPECGELDFFRFEYSYAVTGVKK